MPTNGQYEEETLSLLGNEDPSATGFADLRLENTSFALSPERLIVQAVMPEQFNIRLHEPSVREVAGLKFEFPVGKCATIFGRRGGSGEAVEGGS